MTVQIQAVSHVYPLRSGGDVRVFHGLSMHAPRAKITALMGPSGCGKTTLLRMIAGLLKPSAGEIYVEDILVDRCLPQVGMMFQTGNCLPWLTVLENVIMPPYHRSHRQRDAALQVLEQVDLLGFGDRFPGQLSGGQEQRVALARILLSNKRIWLLDEPFGALDHNTRVVMRELIASKLQSVAGTAILVTHDQSDTAIADRIYQFYIDHNGRATLTLERE
jgi:NitT/TauT family transport system ATP-binding protein